ncbi:hypothetical protein NLU13_4801 [Sarocladium strictum]|uniref:BZIP domain-containing protein n=1 Tax=Sarocladium strictum TaxID=5046 RepID=A0AA39GKY7_SARSR|nr:hypothetical protein NLU13_4801 [Sarocladium strictum]
MMTTSTARADGVPRTRQRIHKTPPPLDVPDIDEDAAERKRVLNVLAQRRYREKKRLARLKDKGPNDATARLDEGRANAESTSTSLSDTDTASPSIHGGDAAQSFPPPPITSSFADDIGEIVQMSGDVNTWDMGLANSICPLDMGTETLPDFGISASAEWLGTSSVEGTIQPSFLESWPPVLPSTSNTNTMSPSYSSSTTDEFADTYLLPVHELKLLKALLRIAGRVGCTDNLWALETLSSFNTNTAPPYDTLPEVWRPTAAQIMVPHHPLIDFLPWPSVRDRLLAIKSLPAEARPTSAGGDMWLLNFAYDLEDNSEGIRIYGGDPYDPESWEVGQKLFESWWFVFDRKVVERSNKWRELRGAPLLTAKSTTGGS